MWGCGVVDGGHASGALGFPWATVRLASDPMGVEACQCACGDGDIRMWMYYPCLAGCVQTQRRQLQFSSLSKSEESPLASPIICVPNSRLSPPSLSSSEISQALLPH